jgi:hypothetical protein
LDLSICLDGFRKVVGAEQGGLRAEKDDWQFQNANFIRSQPRLLENVKRKVDSKIILYRIYRLLAFTDLAFLSIEI